MGYFCLFLWLMQLIQCSLCGCSFYKRKSHWQFKNETNLYSRMRACGLKTRFSSEDGRWWSVGIKASRRLIKRVEAAIKMIILQRHQEALILLGSPRRQLRHVRARDPPEGTRIALPPLSHRSRTSSTFFSFFFTHR